MQKKTKVYVGMDVHKDTVMIAVLAEGAREPTVVKRLSRSSQLQTNPNSCPAHELGLELGRDAASRAAGPGPSGPRAAAYSSPFGKLQTVPGIPSDGVA